MSKRFSLVAQIGALISVNKEKKIRLATWREWMERVREIIKVTFFFVIFFNMLTLSQCDLWHSSLTMGLICEQTSALLFFFLHQPLRWLCKKYTNKNWVFLYSFILVFAGSSFKLLYIVNIDMPFSSRKKHGACFYYQVFYVVLEFLVLVG